MTDDIQYATAALRAGVSLLEGFGVTQGARIGMMREAIERLSMPMIEMQDDFLIKIETGETISWGEFKERQNVKAIGAGREEIARIIDPQAWGAFADEQIAYVEKHNLVHSEKWFGTQHLVRRSETLRQADAILALSPASPAAIGAGREEIEAAVLKAVFLGFEHGECEKEWEPDHGKEIARAATDRILAALPPASPARTPMGEPVAWIERQNDGTRYGEPKRWPPSDRARSYAQEMGRTIEPLYAAASPARSPMGEGRHPLPKDANSAAHDEATGWIVKNCMAVRRDNGDMDYSLGAMIAAYEAGKAAASTPMGGEVEALREAAEKALDAMTRIRWARKFYTDGEFIATVRKQDFAPCAEALRQALAASSQN